MTQPQLLDVYRAGLKGAVDLMKVSLENAERLQNQQLIAIRSALEEQVKMASALGEAKTMDELLAVQTRMAGDQAQRAVGYWASMYESQMTALGQMQGQLAHARDWFSEAAAQTASSAPQAEAATRPAASALGQAKTMNELLGYWASMYETQMTALGQMQAQLAQAAASSARRDSHAAR